MRAMTETANLIDRLACPRCDRALEPNGDGYRCPGCRVDFPAVDGIAWLFAEPGAALEEWRGRWHFALRRLERDSEQLAAALRRPALRASTADRLRRLKEATDDHAARLRALLAPLRIGDLAANYETHLALRTRLPADQGLTTYYNNIHRDWAWGDDENRASFDIVSEALSGTSPGRTLVLGAGGGRLAYDLHMRSAPSVTVALDFNPLLLMLAQRITRGDSVGLYEFPIAPRGAADPAVLRRLSAPEPARGGLSFVLADAHRPPFRRDSFDTVVTPWLVDILPERFDALCARINMLLADGGRWMNFGSLSFHTADPAERYGIEECRDALTENGFAVPALGEHEIPYMCSPASRHGRRERVVSWAATKQHAVKKVARHEALPEWLVRGNEPVPLLDSFRTQALSTRVHAFIMSLIDGRRSLKDMAKLLAEQNVMSRDEAEPAIRSFLIKMYEDSRRATGF
jgi:SAM-dependent methyltransferase